MAPSMAPTVLPTHTAPPLTDSCGCWWVPTVGRHICQISNESSTHGVDLRAIAAVGRCRPWSTQSERSERPAFAFLFLFRGWTRAGNCQRPGGVGLQDRWRHGWRHRAPMDGFTACPANPPRPAKRGF
ncbi:putative transposon-related protein [Stenotrophomonas maltophilia K279a]|uniref:Transposon-related protein n=1 Tax=Stenotrophomonas maltophilia (strain K279a) TaxID=522373 RepID=B2FT24_STRMK|nr:putative transposon-related protein [Stenotrophomonas maltophilia K279a]